MKNSKTSREVSSDGESDRENAALVNVIFFGIFSDMNNSAGSIDQL